MMWTMTILDVGIHEALFILYIFCGCLTYSLGKFLFISTEYFKFSWNGFFQLDSTIFFCSFHGHPLGTINIDQKKNGGNEEKEENEMVTKPP